MMKTPMWGNARLILNVHLEHNTPKIYKNFIRTEKSGLCPTIYAILPLATEKAVKIGLPLHGCGFVTGL